jgi:site-specific recombinase XerD
MIDASSVLEATALAALRIEARTFAERPLTDATRRAYERDRTRFTVWCAEQHVSSFPADAHTLATYLAYLARTDKPATIARKLAAISVAHRDLGLDNPADHGMVRRTLTGIRRQLGTAQLQKIALLAGDLRTIVAPLGETLLDIRDRALLLLGFSAALRRSELVHLMVQDLRFEKEGLVLTLRRLKRNQEGRVEAIAVAYGNDEMTCPVRAMGRWLNGAGLDEGPVFRGLTPQGGLRAQALSDRMVAHIVKRRCKAVGIDPIRVAGHSLRRGFATSAAQAHKSDRSIKRHGRWKGTPMLETYVEEGTRWDDNASAGLGL